ncbi:MAG: hypothetical protein ABJA85_07320 [Bacteroidota bacterium]
MTTPSLGQDSIIGTFFDYKTNQQIQLHRNRIVRLESNHESGKHTQSKSYWVNEHGQFTIDKGDIDAIGDNFTFRIYMFLELGISTHAYASLEIKNIPKDSAKLVLTNIYLMPSCNTDSCCDGCFLLEDRKTINNGRYIVRTPYITYQVKILTDEIYPNFILECETDLKHDILKE